MFGLSSTSPEMRARVIRALVSGVFGMLYALFLTGILLAFLALLRDDSSGLVATIVVAVLGFTIGVWWDTTWGESSREMSGKGSSQDPGPRESIR